MKQFKFRMVVTYEYDFNIKAPDKKTALELCDEFQNIDAFICDTDDRAMKFWDCSRDYDFIKEDKKYYIGDKMILNQTRELTKTGKQKPVQ